MKLAISNIAWNPAEDDAAAATLGALGVTGVEIAPTKVWPTPLDATRSEVLAYRRYWESRDREIVALQALLFGQPTLTIFESEERRERTVAYLARIAAMAGLLGARVLVFGSPSNRRVGELDRSRAEAVAIRFFRAVAASALDQGTVFCIEPNPPQYGCDFVTTALEGLDLVLKVDHPGFGLHLDTGAMTLARDPIEDVLPRAVGYLRYFHISEPELGEVGSRGVDHAAVAAALRKAGYDGWVSVEMRAAAADNMPAVERALRVAKSSYAL